MNRLEVISTIDQSSVAQIAIPNVTSAELSADGATVWTGTAVNEIVAVDSTSLRVTRRYPQAGISPLPSSVFDRPVEVLSLSNGECLFRLRQRAITTLDGTPQSASLTVVQLASVPLAIGSVSASTVPVAGGASITIRGSGFQAGIKVTIGGKSATANYVDMNTITITSPALPAGAQQIVLTNVSGETIWLDAALTAN